MNAAKNGGRVCIVLSVNSGVSEVSIAKTNARAVIKLGGGILDIIGGSAAVGALVAMSVVSGPLGWIALAGFVAGVAGTFSVSEMERQHRKASLGSARSRTGAPISGHS